MARHTVHNEITVISVFFASFYPHHFFLFPYKFYERNSASCLLHMLSKNGEVSVPSWKAQQTEKQNLYFSPWYCLIACAFPWNIVKTTADRQTAFVCTYDVYNSILNRRCIQHDAPLMNVSEINSFPAAFRNMYSLKKVITGWYSFNCMSGLNMQTSAS